MLILWTLYSRLLPRPRSKPASTQWHSKYGIDVILHRLVVSWIYYKSNRGWSLLLNEVLLRKVPRFFKQWHSKYGTLWTALVLRVYNQAVKLKIEVKPLQSD